MRHNPAAGAVVIMLRTLKMHGMAQAVGELTEQGSPAFEAALPILSQLLKAETADGTVNLPDQGCERPSSRTTLCSCSGLSPCAHRCSAEGSVGPSCC